MLVGSVVGEELVGAGMVGIPPAPGAVEEALGAGDVPEGPVVVVEGALDAGAPEVCVVAAMLHAPAPPLGAPACSQAVSVAFSEALRGALGGGGIGFVSLAMRSIATLATVRVGSLLAGR
jgi:hypothetical protein